MLRRPGEYYGRYAIAAAPGTQGAVVNALAHRCSLNSRVLDLGAYTGALISRIRDAGFEKIQGADLANHLIEGNVPFIQCDFNTNFAEKFPGQTFDCVVACEVIEHLNDPRHFLKQCANLLSKDGIIIISTPNISFFEGRIKFLLTGELWGYGAHNYQVQRHISPISAEQFPLLFSECGFELLEMFTAGSFATRLRKIVTSPIWLPMRMLFGKEILGESRICVARLNYFSEEKLSSEALWGDRHGKRS